MLLFSAILSGLGCLRIAAGEIIKAESITCQTPTPPLTHQTEAKSSRPLLLVKQEERGEDIFEDPSSTSYYIYDPAAPEKELTRIFIGPENDQYLSPLIPHHNGWALSEIRLNPERDPGIKSKWAWFHYPDGIIGPEIKEQIWIREIKGDYIFGQEAPVHEAPSKGVRLLKYHPKTGKMEKSKLLFSHTEWIPPTTVLGIAGLDEKERVILFDINRFEYQDLGPPPPDYKSKNPPLFVLRLELAGKNGADGVFTSTWKKQGFALSYLPKGENWIEVITGVSITKTFGGAMPRLPVEYLGGGNFAVSKTTIDSVPVPEDWPEDQKTFGAAQGVTMMIEGASGKILKESEPFIYDHNPPLKIPKNWWHDGFQAKDPIRMLNPENGPTLFNWNEESRELSFANGSKLSLKKAEDYRDSDDGRYALVFREWTKKNKSRSARQTLKIIDGQDGKIQKIKIESEFHEVATSAYWIESAAPSAE